MPKGYTEQAIKAVTEMTMASYRGERSRFEAGSEAFRRALQDDLRIAREQGVPEDYFIRAEQGEIARALKTGFPLKNIGIEYLVRQFVENGDNDGASREASREPNPLQRAVLLERAGQHIMAQDAAREGVRKMLTSLLGQYGGNGGVLADIASEVARHV